MFDHLYHIVQVDPVPKDEQQELFVCILECNEHNALIKLVLEPEATRDLATMLRSYYAESSDTCALLNDISDALEESTNESL